MKQIFDLLGRFGLLGRDADSYLLRAVMIIIFAWFGFDKWHVDEIKQLVPLITHGPFIFWTIPVLGVQGTSYLLGTSEWTFGTLLFFGYWSRTAGILGALGSCATFIATVTILPFVPGAWDPGAGGFPAMSSVGGFLLKDLVLLTVSFCLLRHDVVRAIEERSPADRLETLRNRKLVA